MFKNDISLSPKCRVRSLLDLVVDNGLVHLREVSLTPRGQGRSQLMDMLFPSAPVLPEHSNLSSQIWFSNRLFKFEDNNIPAAERLVSAETESHKVPKKHAVFHGRREIQSWELSTGEHVSSRLLFVEVSSFGSGH